MDRIGQPVDVCRAECLDILKGVEMGQEEDILDVHIANPGDPGLVGEESFEAAAPPGEQLGQILTGQLIGIRPEAVGHFVLNQLAWRSIMCVAEPPEVDRHTILAGKIKNQAVFLRKGLACHQQNLTAHAQREQQPTLACLDHDPFTAAGGFLNLSAS